MKIEFDFKGRGRMMIALIIGIIFIAVKSAFPILPITEEQSLMVIGLIGAYVLGEGVSGKSTDNDILTILKSQKFQALIVGILGTLIKIAFPNIAVSDTDMLAFVGVVMTFIIGSGLNGKTPPPPAEIPVG